MIVRRDFQQGTPEWWAAKCGIPSASCFDRIITSKGKLSAGADKYICELVSDLMNQTPNYFSGRGSVVRRPYLNEDMANGQELEHEARMAFEMDSGMKTEQVGLCLSDDGRFAFSPDALIVGHPAGLELKCPTNATQAGRLLKGEVLPREYKQQVHGALAISGFERYYWYSYSPPLDPLMVIVTPDAYTEALKQALEQFWCRYQEAKVKLLGAA